MRKILKTFKFILILILCIFFIIGGSTLAFTTLSFDFAKEKFTENDYSRIMEESITGNPRVVDIAMLGAHDAFTNKITNKYSKNADNDINSILNKNIVKTFAAGLVKRLSRTQKSSAFELLIHGVRYFDARISWEDNNWYTVHTYLSETLDYYLLDMIKFLKDNPKEFILLDIQCFYHAEATKEDFFEYVESVKFEGKSLLDYINYDPTQISLYELRYNDVIKDGGSVIILFPDYTDAYHYNAYSSVHSVWHNVLNSEDLFKCIENEYNHMVENPSYYCDRFRINQAQKTVIFEDNSTILKSFLEWSLLDLANNFNAELLSHPNITIWFERMPILMVDYSDSIKDNFNDEIIKIINEYNSRL